MSVNESASLGPFGWPYDVVVDGHRAELNGHSLWTLLAGPTTEIGDVMVGSEKRPIPAYEVEIDGLNIRFAAGEVSNGVWIVASNDASISTDNIAPNGVQKS